MDCAAQSTDPCFARAIHGLRDPWIAQPHMCQAFVQKKKGTKGDTVKRGIRNSGITE